MHIYIYTFSVCPRNPDDIDESEEEEESEEDESIHFDEVTEVRFPGEVGPMGDRRLCKIRCVKGKWVGPLCATNEEGMKMNKKERENRKKLSTI